MLFATPGNETKPKANAEEKEKKEKNPNRPEWRGKEKKKKKTEKRKETKKRSLCKKKIKICRLSFITITFFFCTEKHLMGGRAARPGLCAGEQGRAPPPPAAAPLPAPRWTPGKAHPDGFLLPMAGESQQRDARGPLCSVAWTCCCCGFELPSLRVSSCLEKGQDVTAGCRG